MGTSKGSKMAITILKDSDYAKVQRLAEQEKLTVSGLLRQRIMTEISRYENE